MWVCWSLVLGILVSVLVLIGILEICIGIWVCWSLVLVYLYCHMILVLVLVLVYEFKLVIWYYYSIGTDNCVNAHRTGLPVSMSPLLYQDHRPLAALSGMAVCTEPIRPIASLTWFSEKAVTIVSCRYNRSITAGSVRGCVLSSPASVSSSTSSPDSLGSTDGSGVSGGKGRGVCRGNWGFGGRFRQSTGSPVFIIKQESFRFYTRDAN